MPSINDNFASAIEVLVPTDGGTYTSPAIANTGNTTEPGEPTGTDALSMWFKYTPTSSGTATFDTMQSTAITGTDTYMTIFTGTALNNLVSVATSDDEGGAAGGAAATSRVPNLPVTAGTTYWSQVGGYGNTQVNVVFRVVGPASVPPPPQGEGTKNTTAARSMSAFARGGL